VPATAAILRFVVTVCVRGCVAAWLRGCVAWDVDLQAFRRLTATASDIWPGLTAHQWPVLWRYVSTGCHL
jgi:hypothetical protein